MPWKSESGLHVYGQYAADGAPILLSLGNINIPRTGISHILCPCLEQSQSKVHEHSVWRTEALFD